MSKKLTDLSQLTKAILKKSEPQVRKSAPVREPIPHPVKAGAKPEIQEGQPVLSREEAECLAYFSHTSLSDRRYATAGRVRTPPAVGKAQEPAPEPPAELAALKASEARLAAEVAELEKARKASEARLVSEVAELRKALEAAQKRAAAAEQALEERLSQLSAPRAEALSAERPAELRAAKGPQRSVLAVPAGFAEAFPGELREMVVAALRDACETARQGTRERRAAVLEAVLRVNPSSGELERRRSELRQIVKDVAYSNDGHMLKGLERLGMKLVSGRKHWKLEYANVRMPLAKTPSDFRSGLNASADMANRCF